LRFVLTRATVRGMTTPSPVRRIVSLLPSGTELVCALGLRERLVGISHECDFPADVVGLPVLTSSILGHGLSPAEIDAAVSRASLDGRPLYAVDGELLARLEPDLIVTQGVCAVCAVTPDTIGASLELLPVDLAVDAPVLSLSGASWAGIRHDIRTLAAAAGVEDTADALLADLDRRWGALAASPHGERPRLAMLEWPDPPWFGGHWVPEQVAVAGGHDLFGTPGLPSGRMTVDEVVAADPDIIVGIACGFGVEENLTHLQALVSRPELATLRAVKEGRVWAANANGLFSRPGPRVVAGAELLAQLVRGETPSPDDAVLVPIGAQR